MPIDTDITSEDTEANLAKTTEVDENTATDAEADEAVAPEAHTSLPPKRRLSVKQAFILGVLPALALLLAFGVGYLKWQDSWVRESDLARISSVQVAKDASVAMLSYRPDTVDEDLGSARDLQTGDFKNSYTSLTNDVVIPGTKQKQISAVATVPAVASVSANPNHAVALVFVNQTVIVGTDAPTDTASSVKVTLDKISGRWLISAFDPI